MRSDVVEILDNTYTFAPLPTAPKNCCRAPRRAVTRDRRGDARRRSTAAWSSAPACCAVGSGDTRRLRRGVEREVGPPLWLSPRLSTHSGPEPDKCSRVPVRRASLSERLHGRGE